MNYEGYVSSVNTTLCTFQLDNKITVHTIHQQTNNSHQLLPNIGEFVQISNSHYMLTDNYDLDKLFLCDRSKMACDYYQTIVKESILFNLVNEYKLGVSDLLEIDNNLKVIEKYIKPLVQESPEEVVFEVLNCLISKNCLQHQQNSHWCLNQVVPTFNLKTVSNLKYIHPEFKKVKCPAWSFGTHSKDDECDILIGNLQINKRYGLIFLCDVDADHKIPCLITSKESKREILNKFVLIKNYRVFTETYRDTDIPNFHYILFDVDDVVVLNLQPVNVNQNEIFFKAVPEDCCFIYDFQFKLIGRATVGLQGGSIQCWLEVLIENNCDSYNAYLCLNTFQVRVVPFLQEGETYHVYHSEKLNNVTNRELSRLKPYKMLVFVDKHSIFVHKSKAMEEPSHILDVSQAVQKVRETNNSLSFQGLLNIKKLTPSLSSRTESLQRENGFGTPGKYTHTLEFVDDLHEKTLILYINNWENLQIPLGLIPSMRICVKNVVPQKNKYLKCTAMTTFEVLSYEPPVYFDTINLNNDLMTVNNKSSFLGLGDVIPANVLISCKPLQMYIRSLRIAYKCEKCDIGLPVCSCDGNSGLETTLTFYVNDEKGQALVISKSVELLRCLLDLEVAQWKIWCNAFKKVKEYTYERDGSLLFSYESDVNVFCEALLSAIKVINTTKLINLELECRKMDSSSGDNEGMPLWFCTSARKCNEFL